MLNPLSCLRYSMISPSHHVPKEQCIIYIHPARTIPLPRVQTRALFRYAKGIGDLVQKCRRTIQASIFRRRQRPRGALVLGLRGETLRSTHQATRSQEPPNDLILWSSRVVSPSFISRPASHMATSLQPPPPRRRQIQRALEYL